MPRCCFLADATCLFAHVLAVFPRVALQTELALTLVAGLPTLSKAACRLPFTFPNDVGLSGVTVGPKNSLVLASDDGKLVFADLEDFSLRVDTALNDKYRDSYGWLDLEGVAMTSPESTYLYFGMENKAAIVEYEWRSSHRIFRQFILPGFEHHVGQGLQSLTWVPTQASKNLGYFYVGSRLNGGVYIYEAPLLDNTGSKASAQHISKWIPLESHKHIAGLSYSAGFLFLCYEDGRATRVLIYKVDSSTGQPGPLEEQYEVDIPGAGGLSVRQIDRNTWEVFFASDTKQDMFAYTFRFVTGFESHTHCSVGHPRTSGSTRRNTWQATGLWLLYTWLAYVSVFRHCIAMA